MLVHLYVPPSLVLYLPECHWAFRDETTRVPWNDFARILQSWLLPHKIEFEYYQNIFLNEMQSD